jgi:hypothetical protein
MSASDPAGKFKYWKKPGIIAVNLAISILAFGVCALNLGMHLVRGENGSALLWAASMFFAGVNIFLCVHRLLYSAPPE